VCGGLHKWCLALLSVLLNGRLSRVEQNRRMMFMAPPVLGLQATAPTRCALGVR
jgi:hypothetical protein